MRTGGVAQIAKAEETGGEPGATGPTTNPMTSPHGNYVVFERGGQVHLLHVGAK